MSVTAAIIAGIATLVGGGISAHGASEAAKEEERMANAMGARTDRQFNEQMAEQRKNRTLQGMGLLAQERTNAMMLGNQKSFGKDLAKAFSTMPPRVAPSTTISAAPKIGGM